MLLITNVRKNIRPRKCTYQRPLLRDRQKHQIHHALVIGSPWLTKQYSQTKPQRKTTRDNYSLSRMPKDTSHPTTKPSVKGNRKQRPTPTLETKTDFRKEQYNNFFLVGDHVCIIMEEPLATNQTPYTSKYGGTTTLPWPPIYGVIVGKNKQESTADIETFVMIGEIWTRILKKAPLQGLINSRQADLISRDIALNQIKELQHQLINIPAQHRKQLIPAVNLSCYGRDTKSVNRERNLSQPDFQIQQHSDDIITSLANRNRSIFWSIQRIVMSVYTDGEASDTETPKLEGIIYLLVQLGNERKLRQPAVFEASRQGNVERPSRSSPFHPFRSTTNRYFVPHRRDDHSITRRSNRTIFGERRRVAR
jgi:hypothetical protein